MTDSRRPVEVVSIVGTRPQLIKAATVSRAFDGLPGVSETLVHTGQHHEARMSDVFFEELGLRTPSHNLNVRGGSHGAMTGQMLEKLDQLLLDLSPDLVLTYGDTNSTLAGALAAAKLRIPLAHVEAGLRSFDRDMPEEINRIVTDHLSRLYFCPTTTAVANLRAEGIIEHVHLTGDVMYDGVLWAKERIRGRQLVVEMRGLASGEYGVATVHRAENTGSLEALERVVTFLRRHAEKTPIVLPLHPRTRDAAMRWGTPLEGLHVVDPLGYLDMCRLVAGASAVFTDSGGLQKEAYFFGVPCVTLRDSTEWVETIEAGWNRLWTVDEYLPRRAIEEYGDGTAAVRIAHVIATMDVQGSREEH